MPPSPATIERPPPPIAVPPYLAPYINPLAFPRSFGGSRSMAIASTQTSCRLLQMLCRTTKIPSVRRSATGSGIMAMATSVAIMPVCATRIHGRRRPKRELPKRSTNGPHTHLSAHGSVPSANTDAIASVSAPDAAIAAASVTVRNPKGTPCATYSAQSTTILMIRCSERA